MGQRLGWGEAEVGRVEQRLRGRVKQRSGGKEGSDAAGRERGIWGQAGGRGSRGACTHRE